MTKSSRPSFIAWGDIERIAALVLASGLNVLPTAVRTKAIDQTSRVMSALWHKTNTGSVKCVRRNLMQLFRYQETDRALEPLVRLQLRLAVWNALIANLLPSLREEHLAHLFQFQGLHHVQEAQRQGRLPLLLGFHYGAYGYAIAAALSTQGYPTRLVGYGHLYAAPPGTSYVYRKLYWPRLQRVNQWVETIVIDPAQRSHQELQKVLGQEGQVVYLLADQYFVVPPDQTAPSYLAPLSLLDHTVYLDVSGVQLAKEMNALPFTLIPESDGPLRRVSIEPMEWAGAGTAKSDVVQDLQLYLGRLEQSLLQCPALWRELRRPVLLSRMGIFEDERSTDG